MKLAHPFTLTHTDSPPPTTDAMMEKITKLLPKTKWIRVDRRDGGPRSSPKWAEVNRITPERGPSGEVIDEPVEVAYFIIWCAMHYLDENIDDATDVFRALFFVEEDGNTKPKPVQFSVVRDGEEYSRRSSDEEYEPLSQNIVMASFSQLTSHYNGFIATVLAHAARLETHLLETHKSTQQQQASTQNVIEKMSSVYHTGLTMQQNSMQSILEVEKNIKAQELEAKRADRMMQFLEKAAPQAFELMQYKLGIKEPPAKKAGDKKAQGGKTQDAAAKDSAKETAPAEGEPAANASASSDPDATHKFALHDYTFSFLSVDQVAEYARINKKSHDEVPYYLDLKEPDMTEADIKAEPFLALIVSLRKSITLEQGTRLKAELPEEIHTSLEVALKSTDLLNALQRIYELRQSLDGKTDLYGVFMSILTGDQLSMVMSLTKFVQMAIDKGAFTPAT